MNSYSLPGISKIQIVRCKHLGSNAMLQSISGMIVAVVAPSETIKFCGKPELKWESNKVNGKNQEKSTLQFSTVHHIPENERLAFVVSCVGGKQYLIGTREGNYPIIEFSETTGEPGRTSAVRTYKITHVAQKSVLRCVL